MDKIHESFPHIEGFIRLPDVLKILCIGKTSFLKGIREGRFPKPIKLGPRISVWKVADIRKMIDDIGADTKDPSETIDADKKNNRN